MKHKIGGGNQRLDAVAQVIAECDGQDSDVLLNYERRLITFSYIACDWNNRKRDFCVPIYGILCDGYTFEFFLFDGSTKPFSFKRGLVGSDDPPTSWRPLQLSKLEFTSTTRPFVNSLRPICEVIFDLLLRGYVSSMKVYQNHSMNKSTREGQTLDEWEEATSAAVRALQGFRDAETKRQAQLIDEADLIAEEAMISLKCRYEIPTFSGIVISNHRHPM